jgi:hypothetical protein
MDNPVNWWIWCVYYGHNLHKGRCLRCGEEHEADA